MANTVQKYVNSKICCISSSVHQSDTKIKYGAEDAHCCIINDAIANIFIEMLSCNSTATDALWYKVDLTVGFKDKAIPEYVYGDPLTIAGLQYVTSFDGNLTVPFSFAGDWPTGFATIAEVNEAFAELIDYWGTNTNNPTIFWNATYDTVTSNISVIIYHTDAWGNDVNRPSISGLTGGDGTPFTSGVNVNSWETTDGITTNSCLTGSEQCDIKEWLDKYCNKCSGGYSPEPVTENLI